MKPVLALSLIVAALFAGFVGATAAVVLGVGASSQNQPAVAAASSTQRDGANSKASDRSGAAAAESAVLSRQVDDLGVQVAALRGELEGLRSDIARQATPSAAPVLVAKADEIAAVQHDAVVKILQEQKDLEQKKRDEERKARDLQQIKDRAARAAKELGLGAADETRLVDFMTTASAKRDEMFAGTRDGNFDRETMRKNFEDYRTWTETELKAQFGADLAEQLLKMQRDGRGGGWGGDFGGGGGPPAWGGQGQNGQPGQGGQPRATQTKQGQ
jgi:hypothetical protein